VPRKEKKDWQPHPTRFRLEGADGSLARFYPPRPNRFWDTLLKPIRRYYARRNWRVVEVETEGMEAAFECFGKRDGVLIAPNHSHEGDAHGLIEATRGDRRRVYFMAAWEAFRGHWGLDGWLLARMGAFSVDREGVDRRAVRQATELLATGNSLVVFPEGEIHHLNQRLKPLLDGIAFMAMNAQREVEKADSDARVWILPAAIQYRLAEDREEIERSLDAAMTRLEARMAWIKSPRGAPLGERIVRFGEMLLTLKEKEKLGGSREGEGDLAARVAHLSESLLERYEGEYLKGGTGTKSTKSLPLRVKALRRCLLDVWSDDSAEDEARARARDALDDVQLALQLSSYPGDYITEKPTRERMAETIEKFEEDIFGFARSIGRRRARVLFGKPVDMKAERGAGRPRAVVAGVTDRLEQAIRELMAQG